MNLIEHLTRQILFSTETFGPGDRHGGVTDHLRKELIELGAPPSDLELLIMNQISAGFPYSPEVYDIIRERAMRRGEIEKTGDPDEWVDLVLLSLDGMWRAISRDAGDSLTPSEMATIIAEKIEAKQTKNEKRDWPDWRTMSADAAIEHSRLGEV